MEDGEVITILYSRTLLELATLLHWALAKRHWYYHLLFEFAFGSWEIDIAPMPEVDGGMNHAVYSYYLSYKEG